MLHIDYETRSELELGGVGGYGLHNYAIHPSTKILMLAWAFGNDEPSLWLPHLEPLPMVLSDAFRNPDIILAAFNSAFERYITQYKLGIEIPVSRFQDPQASARYLSLPANLEDVGMVLGLPKHLRKDKRGDTLLDLFAYPQTRKKKELKTDPSLPTIYFNDHESHPDEFAALGEYCLQDVRAEREIARRLSLLQVYPLPEHERKIWLFDQKVNDRGIPADRTFVEKAFRIADKNKEEKLQLQNDATGLDNANSQQQFLPWAQERGYPLNNLRKNNVELILNSKNDGMDEGSIPSLSDECRRVLEARVEASSSSYKKLAALLRNISPDGRLRGQFIYMGSSRCGRWSGNAVQLHNFPRPDGVFEDMSNVIKARNFIYEDDYYGIGHTFEKDKKKLRPVEEPIYSPLIVIKNLLRTVFVAPKNKRLNVCDLNAIETRVAAWVAQCKPLLKVFELGRDPYLDFATKMYGILYERLAADLKSKDPAIKAAAKLMRQIAKPGVLGAVYRLGPGGWGKDKNGDRIKTGLWGYAAAMGIEMTLEQAQQVVKIFREAYEEIGGHPRKYDNFPGGIWYILENAVKDVLEGERTIRKVGPDGCIVIDKITIEDKQNETTRIILRIKLPSGRYLHYIDASIETVKMPWTKKEVSEETGEETEVSVYKPGFCYYGKDQKTDQWSMIVSHGGKIFENIVQAIARDVLCEGMLRVDELGMEICGHVHDEIIALTDDCPFAPGVLEMQKFMSEPVPWAPTLPLGAEGFEDFFYHK